ncbi:MAG: hypothetical protein RL266_1177 [Bacteroidota bacterium]
MNRIPLHDVITQNRSIQVALNDAWNAVNDSGLFINGPQVKQFQRDFSQYIGTDHCIGVGNATDGFEITFQALGLNAGDEVIIPANAHVSPALAALKVGLKPVFCDVDEARMLLNAETVSAQITDRTKAVVAVHLYGRVCPMSELKKLCEEHDLLLVEDFSQAHGASFNQQKVGSIGDVSVCSFYPTKPLGALGDGGAILTSNSELAERCLTLANYGWKERDNISIAGRNSRLDELQAAILNVKLQHLEKWNADRLEKAKELQRRIGDSVAEFQNGDVCHLFVLRSARRDELKRFLVEIGVDCQVHYPIPIHRQALFNSHVHLPVAENLCKQILSVPVDDRVSGLLVRF